MLKSQMRQKRYLRVSVIKHTFIIQVQGSNGLRQMLWVRKRSGKLENDWKCISVNVFMTTDNERPPGFREGIRTCFYFRSYIRVISAFAVVPLCISKSCILANKTIATSRMSKWKHKLLSPVSHFELECNHLNGEWFIHLFGMAFSCSMA